MRAKGRSPTSAIAPPASIENHASGQSPSQISMKLLGCQQSHSMTVVRKAGYFLLAYFCAFILANLIPEQIDRREYAIAVDAYTRDPTPENEVALRAQRRENERLHLRDTAILGLVLVVVGYGIWGGSRLVIRLVHRTDPRDMRR